MVQVERDLVDVSLAILRDGQAETGAFIASPNFPVYHYCWFRDGTFIAQALDLWGRHEMSHRFYAWGVDVIRRQAPTVEAALQTSPGDTPSRYLHARYTLDGMPGDEDWPNFQLDGFGTFLWGMVEHLEATGSGGWPSGWEDAARLLTRYIGHLWMRPSSDCWEEFADKVHLATLAALCAGIQSVARYGGDSIVRRASDEMRQFILDTARPLGYLPKFVGTDVVDASLLWACIPFGILSPEEPAMAATVERIRTDLVGSSGGVHRYAGDTYYGGGSWLLLTALLGEYLLEVGETDAARTALRWIEEKAGANGSMPEQVPLDLNASVMYEPWLEQWGPVADPLLWSHAAYLRLRHRLDKQTDASSDISC